MVVAVPKLVEIELHRYQNKAGTSQVGAMSKAQKAQNIFLEKNLKFSRKKFFQEMSHSAEKCKRGSLFDLKTRILWQKKTENSKGGPFGDNKKISKKSRTVSKKIERGDPLVPSGLVGNV